jgi:RNA polymerase sigma factor (sigma-70 family)
MAAYAELVRRYEGPALRTASLLAADSAEAEDAVQEAFFKAHGALGRFRDGSPFRPWLLRIVANEARNRRRSAGRRHGLALRVAEDLSPFDAVQSPEAAVLANEARETLLAAIGRLEPEDRLVIGYRYFMDLSEGEMAEALNVARGTVKSRLFRAMARLRVALQESER